MQHLIFFIHVSVFFILCYYVSCVVIGSWNTNNSVVAHTSCFCLKTKSTENQNYLHEENETKKLK